jgi:mannose-6-phosphate isomerase-like protein (cupin superfamily)
VTVPFSVQADDVPVLPTPTGDSARVLANGARTGGTMAIFDLAVAAGSGPALHSHTLDDELWYVLAGEFRFRAGDRMLHASTGGMAFGPHGTPHAFQNVGEGPGRLLIVTTPSGLDRFFEQYAARLPAGVGSADLAALAQDCGFDFVGPPLAVSEPL